MKVVHGVELIAVAFMGMFALLSMGGSLHLKAEPGVSRDALWAEVTGAPNLAPQRLTVTLTDGERVTFGAPAGAGACLMVMVWTRNSNPGSTQPWPVALRTPGHPGGIDARDIAEVGFTLAEPTEEQMKAARDSRRCPGMQYQRN